MWAVTVRPVADGGRERRPDSERRRTDDPEGAGHASDERRARRVPLDERELRGDDAAHDVTPEQP